MNEAIYKKFSPRDKLACARLAARVQYPYFAAALLNLVPREAPDLGTLGVTETMVLLWDPKKVDSWSLEFLVGVLVHEVGHVLRAHAQRAKALSVVGQDGKPIDARLAMLLNMANDCEINDDLVANHPVCFKGPDGGALPKQFGLPDGLSAEAYYRELRQRQQEQDEAASSGKEPHMMAGKCGSCAGNPVDGEPQAGQDAEGRSPVEVERVRQEVAQAVQSAATQRGTVPAGWEHWAAATLTPPKIRWQDKLARLCRNAVAWRAGAVDLTHGRLSRRQWGVGVGPGRPMVSAFRAPVPHVACVVDTSGSMSDEQLDIALREVKGVMDGVGARITFCSCDAEVHALRQIADWREATKLLKGGGGTSFVPAFAALAKLKVRPSTVVFATDGYGDAPVEAPSWCKTIWLLTGPSTQKPATWGEEIKVDD